MTVDDLREGDWLTLRNVTQGVNVPGVLLTRITHSPAPWFVISMDLGDGLSLKAKVKYGAALDSLRWLERVERRKRGEMQGKVIYQREASE